MIEDKKLIKDVEELLDLIFNYGFDCSKESQFIVDEKIRIVKVFLKKYIPSCNIPQNIRMGHVPLSLPQDLISEAEIIFKNELNVCSKRNKNRMLIYTFHLDLRQLIMLMNKCAFEDNGTSLSIDGGLSIGLKRILDNTATMKQRDKYERTR